MKKGTRRVIILSIIAIILTIYVIFFQVKFNGITNENLVKKIFPAMDDYCENLTTKATKFTCPTCKNNMTECTFVSEEEFKNGSDVCALTKKEENFILQVNRQLIYGVETRTRRVKLEFEIDEKGNILSQKLPEVACL